MTDEKERVKKFYNISQQNLLDKLNKLLDTYCKDNSFNVLKFSKDLKLLEIRNYKMYSLINNLINKYKLFLVDYNFNSKKLSGDIYNINKNNFINYIKAYYLNPYLIDNIYNLFLKYCDKSNSYITINNVELLIKEYTEYNLSNKELEQIFLDITPIIIDKKAVENYKLSYIDFSILICNLPMDIIHNLKLK